MQNREYASSKRMCDEMDGSLVVLASMPADGTFI